MLGIIIVPLLFIAVIIACLIRPPLGAIGFYFFYLLDPKWNWRWIVPQDIQFQKYIFAALVIGLIIQGIKVPKQSRLTRRGIALGFLFFFFCSLSAMQSISPATSTAFNSVLWKELIVAFLAILSIRTRQHATYLLVGCLIAITYNAYQINLDYFQTGFSRYAYYKWGSYQLDNNTLSLAMIPFIGVALSFAIFERIVWRRACFFIAALLLMHQLMLTMSRGAMVGAAPALSLILLKAPKTRSNFRDFSLVFAAGIVLAGPPVVKEFSSIFVSEGERDSSAQSRLHLWNAGAKITADYPLLGVGPNSGRYLVPTKEYWDGPAIEKGSKALHNVYLDVSTGMGIPALLAYLAMFGIPVISAWKAYDPDDYLYGRLNLSVLSGLMIYFGASFFSSGLLIESPFIFLVAGYALINIRNDAQTDMHRRDSVSMSKHSVPAVP